MTGSGAEGRTTVHPDRAVLPSCASADGFGCSFPPPRNTLGVAIEAGARALRRSGHRPWWAGMRLAAAG
ncbi:DUF1684 domain-containing protein [Streptomyces sp. NPDC091280]|uniref:DUF1684 domain-containing protein n=1 Tax=Streptomyces sp. NPDC091280 TaxID=3365984 RepID=UPI00382D0545